MAHFAKIGVGAGKTFDASKLPPEIKTAVCPKRIPCKDKEANWLPGPRGHSP
jgi:hypothetical protein